MNVTVFPSKLSGTVNIPSSKSFSHRYLIAAALADGVSRITNVTDSVEKILKQIIDELPAV